VIPGATVVAEAVETAARYETVSGGDGQYVLPFLAHGSRVDESRYRRERSPYSL
jgi:hypothetical protein